jgi:ribosomal protein S7
MLESTMMDYPLTIPLMLERAKQLFPHVEVVSLLPGAPNPETKMPTPFEHRTNYAMRWLTLACNQATGLRQWRSTVLDTSSFTLPCQASVRSAT